MLRIILFSFCCGFIFDEIMDIAVYVHRLFFIVVFMHQANCMRPLPSATFHCEDRRALVRSRGNYISADYFCDQRKDCKSGEDEGVGCNINCNFGTFYCDHGECKNMTVRCNTIKDCKDGTDELNCGEEVNVNNCTREEQFLCKDGLRCLNLDYTCNGWCNCFDCSDENENCTKHDYELLNRCPHAYFVTAHGPQCLCSPDTNTSSSILCNSIENCEDDWEFNNFMEACYQRCIRFGIKAQCTCYKGYHAESGTFSGFQCSSDGEVLLLYSNSVEIKSLDENTRKISTIVEGITNCTVMTAANNYVYYVTFSQNATATISKASFHAGKSEKLIEMNFNISCIAVDYITNNIYFTGNGSLMVCTNDGQICKQLKCCGVGYVALNPQRGFMFYTLQTQHNDEEFAVMRSNLDGSNETTLTDNLYKGKVTIKVEESKNILYLLQINNIGNEQVFHEISIESLERVTDVSWRDISDMERIQSFSPHESGVFFFWPSIHGVTYLKLIHDHDTYVLPINDHNIDDIPPLEEINELHVYNEAIQHTDENPCDKSVCSGLCLLKPEMHSASHFLSFTCVCNGFTPKAGILWCGNEIVTEVHHGVFWIIASIIVVTILGVVGAYYIAKKKNWYFYYSMLREWQQGERDQRIILKN